LLVKAAVENLPLPRKNKNFMNQKGSKNPKNVNHVVMLQSRAVVVVDMAVVVAVDMAVHLVNCMMQHVPLAVSKLKCLFSLMAANRFIAVIVTKAAPCLAKRGL
jgi:hypothetical protein